MDIIESKSIKFGKNDKAAVDIYSSFSISHLEATLILHQNNDAGSISPWVDRDSPEVIKDAIILSFYDPRSIDVLISRLEMCKKYFLDEEYREYVINKQS